MTTEGDPMGESPLERLRPLSDWVWCDVTVHFAGGGVVSTPMTQADARVFSDVIKGEHAGSRIDWSAKRWMAVAEDRVDFLEVRLQPDCGWGGLTVRERERFGTRFPHGILRALIDLHAERGGDEPSYAATSLGHLHLLLTEDPTADFEFYADALEGKRGIRLVERAKRQQEADLRGAKAEDGARSMRAEEPATDESEASEQRVEPDTEDPDARRTE